MNPYTKGMEEQEEESLSWIMLYFILLPSCAKLMIAKNMKKGVGLNLFCCNGISNKNGCHRIGPEEHTQNNSSVQVLNFKEPCSKL